MSRFLTLALIVVCIIGCGSSDGDAPLKVEGPAGAPPAGQSAEGLQVGSATTPPIPGK